MLLFILATAACLAVAEAVVGPILAWLLRGLHLGTLSSDSWVEMIGLLGGTAVSVRWIDKRPWSDVWMDASAARPPVLALGFGLGALAIGLPILVLIGAHWLARATGGPGAVGSWGAAAARVSLLLIPAALAEELLTRGYIFAVLRQVWGWKWALVVMSVVFGLLHLQNNGADAESLILVTIAGIFLGGVLVATRSVYAAWMAHLAWNWTMAVLFHASVSGIPLESPGYRYVDAGPDWATGGVWGPEGGVPAGLGMMAGVGIAYLIARRSRSARRNTASSVRDSSGA